ncbi:hypothetical protein GCM10028783_39370 [Modestobacter muralis]
MPSAAIVSGTTVPSAARTSTEVSVPLPALTNSGVTGATSTESSGGSVLMTTGSGSGAGGGVVTAGTGAGAAAGSSPCAAWQAGSPSTSGAERTATERVAAERVATERVATERDPEPVMETSEAAGATTRQERHRPYRQAVAGV